MSLVTIFTTTTADEKDAHVVSRRTRLETGPVAWVTEIKKPSDFWEETTKYRLFTRDKIARGLSEISNNYHYDHENEHMGGPRLSQLISSALVSSNN
jgi:hypothetical protein